MTDASRIETVAIEGGGAAARSALDHSPLGTIQIARPPVAELAYRTLVKALLGVRGFRLDFNRMPPDAAIDLVADRLFGPDAYRAERAGLSADITALADFAGDLTGGAPSISLRSYFAPGDLVWHVDRVLEGPAFRLLWPIGRVAGMRVTPADTIDAGLYRAYMQREYPLLGQLDSRVLHQGGDVAALWAHRPVQLAAMQTGEYPFVIDRTREVQVAAGAASIHRVETPAQTGVFHRSDWANRTAPGLQVVVNVADPQ
ncbi:hypothetical protein [Sphingomonas sp. AX6]|uniref:hypothetical protein n=1 Tax=Sphingomonas sp. AX6 TaxID=2653171 RepID=UPI0012F174B1|nr:hypothetical protein [Sphingomonas sp. AX6]VXC85333.1 conserved hypothetical protein [Sphingomonas sp. AX6]